MKAAALAALAIIGCVPEAPLSRERCLGMHEQLSWALVVIDPTPFGEWTDDRRRIVVDLVGRPLAQELFDAERKISTAAIVAAKAIEACPWLAAEIEQKWRDIERGS